MAAVGRPLATEEGEAAGGTLQLQHTGDTVTHYRWAASAQSDRHRFSFRPKVTREDKHCSDFRAHGAKHGAPASAGHSAADDAPLRLSQQAGPEGRLGHPARAVHCPPPVPLLAARLPTAPTAPTRRPASLWGAR